MVKITIYTLTNPIDGNVFYIGRTVGKLATRLSGHMGTEAMSFYSPKNIIMKSIIIAGELPIIEEIESYLCKNEGDEIFVNKMEDFYINQFKAWGFDVKNFHGIKTPYKIKPLIKWHKLKVNIPAKLIIPISDIEKRIRELFGPGEMKFAYEDDEYLKENSPDIFELKRLLNIYKDK